MKFFFSTILTVIISVTADAQSVDSTAKYIWKNEATNISAVVEIYGAQFRNKYQCLFYLNSVDTVYNNISDSLFKAFVNLSAASYPIIKISFYNTPDSLPAKKLKSYAEEFSTFIIGDIKKRYPLIRTQNPIVYGVNYFALVALSAAINNAQKINKGALFFNEDAAILENISSVETGKLKGKFFLYVNHQNKENFFEDAFTSALALNSSVVLYKFDQFDNLGSSNIFDEAFKWLLADGNNFIIQNTGY